MIIIQLSGPSDRKSLIYKLFPAKYFKKIKSAPIIILNIMTTNSCIGSLIIEFPLFTIYITL